MNVLTREMRRKAKRFANMDLCWLSNRSVAGALLEMFAVGLATGAELASRKGPVLPLLVETSDAAKELTGGVQFFASKPKKKRPAKNWRK